MSLDILSPTSDERALKPQNEDVMAFAKCAEENTELFASTVIFVPHRPLQGVDPDLHRMLCTWSNFGIAHELKGDEGGGFIEVMRGKLVNDFISDYPDQKYLIMIDDDMVPNIWLPYMLLRHRKPIVGGVAASNGNHGPMLCFTIKDTEGDYRFPCLRWVKRMPRSGLLEVGHVGTGAVCIDKEVFLRFCFQGDDTPFFVREHIRQQAVASGKLLRGEDIEFCYQARKKGFPIYVDLEAIVGHRKPVALVPDEELRDASMTPGEWILEPEGTKIGMG